MVVSNMREMKDSGIAFVGVIPKDWEVLKNKYLFDSDKVIVGDDFVNYQLLSLTTKGITEKDINNPDGKLPETFGTYQMVKSKDLVLCLFDLDVSAVFSGISNYDGMISPAYKVISCNEKLLPRYADYWFRTVGYDRNYLLYSKSLRNTINAENFKEIPTIVPPLTIQQSIANYLDQKISLIDNIIEKTKQSIEEYKKLKQSIITETVTKGLNLDVRMKEAGIEWIGMIPEHWEVTIAKHVIRKLERPRFQNGNTVICSNHGKSKLLGENSVGLVSLTQHDYQGVKVGDLLIHGMDTWHGAIALSEHEGDCTSVVHVCDSDFNKLYISYFLKMLAIKSVYKVISNGVRQNTSDFRSWDKVGNIVLILPPVQEQSEIADWIDSRVRAIEHFVEQKEDFILKLESYKKSLIYEVVTGKKEIA